MNFLIEPRKGTQLFAAAMGAVSTVDLLRVMQILVALGSLVLIGFQIYGHIKQARKKRK